MRLILVRHGETQANVEKRYLGHSDSPLTDKGWEQAHHVAKSLLDLGLAAAVQEDSSQGQSNEDHRVRLYTSDLGRCLATANIIGKLIGLEPIIEPDLRELNFGEWDGMTYEDIMSNNRSLAERWYEDPFTIPPPGGETVAEMGVRLDHWLNCRFITDTEVDEITTIIVVTHGGPIRWFHSKHVLGDESRFWQSDTVPAGQYVIIENERYPYKRT